MDRLLKFSGHYKNIFLSLCIYPALFSSFLLGQNIPIIRSIEFEGNRSISNEKLYGLILTQLGTGYSDSLLSSDMNRIVEFYRQNAFFQATVDSIDLKRDSAHDLVDIRFHIQEGRVSLLRNIEVEGCSLIKIEDVRAVIKMHAGDRFVRPELEKDIQSILQLYERKGFPLAKVSIKNVASSDSDSERSIDVTLKIDEGKELHILEMRIEGNRTTRDYVITREARLKENELFYPDLPVKVKRRLDHLQLFASVSMPELYLTDSGNAGLLVRVSEGNQNSFDGVLGYIPSSNVNGSGYITGLINISLRNLFGSGRKLSARWYQENKTTQETELHYYEPWVASYPVNLQLGFFQRKQDSTFVRNEYDISSDLMLTEELSLGASFSQSSVYPTEGYGQKVIPASSSTSIGALVRYDSRDNPTTPTGGILYITEYQSGVKKSSGSQDFPAATDNTIQRLIFDLAYYLSFFQHQVLASELHLRDFKSSAFDPSDLFRIGGATTLRGYREGQFSGSRLVWVNLEYRFLVAIRSFFYGFVDAGYIRQPDIPAAGISASEKGKLGYGIGVRLDSAVGLIGVSLALGEGDTFSTSKIHIRLINEF